LQIRKARPADWEACANLDHSVVTEHAWQMEQHEHEGAITVTFQPVRLPRPLTLRYPRQGDVLRAGWERSDLFLVAVSERTVHGYLTALALPGHGWAWVQDVVVDPAYRRQGLGRRLMQEAAAWARQQHLVRLVAEVQTRNYPAICFCRALGLVFCGYHDRHWRTQEIAALLGQSLH
jgi:GNAT superfamily N-acetyltransferase